jgi:hypothetical protein
LEEGRRGGRNEWDEGMRRVWISYLVWYIGV